MKERLIGAAVLIVAAIIVIPVLLDGPQTETSVTSSESRELSLPAAESTSVRTHVVQLSKPEDTAAEGVSTEVEPEANNAAVETATAITVPSSNPGPAIVADATADAAPASLPKSGNKPPLTTIKGETPGWAVQVGSFTSESNARRLAGLLQSSGYRSFVTRNVVEGRVMYRVRVGPEVDRDRAEALAERLREERQQAQLVRHP